MTIVPEVCTFAVTTHNDRPERQLGAFYSYDVALKFAQEQAFIRRKLLAIKTICSSVTDGFYYKDAPRLVPSSEWIRSRLGEG